MKRKENDWQQFFKFEAIPKAKFNEPFSLLIGSTIIGERLIWNKAIPKAKFNEPFSLLIASTIICEMLIWNNLKQRRPIYFNLFISHLP